MYTDGQEAEFRDFVRENMAFWREFTGFPFDAAGRIYVDLSHDNPAYLLTNLQIAKYLQRLGGGKVVGLALGWRKACPHYSLAKIETLAESFLVDEVIDLDSPNHEDIELVALLSNRVARRTGANLRRTVLSFGEDVDPHLGRILYDTWRREERRATFETVDEGFIECARFVFKARRAVAAAMSTGTALRTVVGHYQYSPYAWMVLESIRRRAPVFFQSLLLPVSVRRFATEEDFEQGRPGDFLPAYENLVVRRAEGELLESFARRMFDVQQSTRQFFKVVPDSDEIRPRRETLRDFDLNPEQPVVCLLVPALSSPAHCFGPLLFDDHADWLRQSLDIATNTPAVNFLVKRHPLDDVYDLSGFVDLCEAQYGHYPNIRFLSPHISLTQLTAVCDVAVTVSGTPGYELPARGIPTIAAGPSRYSALRLAVEPASSVEYEALLQNPALVESNATQRRAAIAFFFFETVAGRCDSSFIPPEPTAGTPEFWREAERNLRARFAMADPLFRHLSRMVTDDLPFLVNSDLIPLDGAPPPTVRPPLESLLGGLHAIGLTAIRELEARASAAERDASMAAARLDGVLELVATWIDEGLHVRLGREHAGGMFLGTGWSVPEEGGVWTDGEEARVSIPSRRDQSLLCLACTGYAPTSSGVRHVSMWCDGRQVLRHALRQGAELEVLRIPVHARNGHVEVTLRIDQPLAPPEGTRRLGLWVSELWLDPSVFC